LLKRIEKRGKMALASFVALFLRSEPMAPESFAEIDPVSILVIRQHNQMDDLFLAVPAFRGLRNRFPKARITLLAASINTDVMMNNPYVDEVLTYARERNRRNPVNLLRFVRSIRGRRFDLVIVLNTVSFSVTSMLLAAVSGARLRIGSSSRKFGHDLTGRFYHLELPLPSEGELARMHESEHNIYPLRAIGVRPDGLESFLAPTEKEISESESLVEASFGKDQPFIVVHPGADKKQNVWPPERFAELVRRLRGSGELGVAAVRGPVDGEVFDDFLQACGGVTVVLSSPVVGLLGAVMKRAVLTLCNDTGIIHIAGAVGANCCAVFGSTDPSRWKPVNGSVVAVRAVDGKVGSVSVEDVLSAALPFLERS
jgi:ADP-heptose:LPS heptosyltransferase